MIRNRTSVYMHCETDQGCY